MVAQQAQAQQDEGHAQGQAKAQWHHAIRPDGQACAVPVPAQGQKCNVQTRAVT